MSRIDYFSYTFAGMDTSSPNFYDFFLAHYDSFFPRKVSAYIAAHDLECVICSCGNGYRRRISYPNIGISVMYQGVTPEHGCHVVLSGTILSLADMRREDYQDFSDEMPSRLVYFKQLLYNDIDLWFRVSRCDIAYDFDIPFHFFLQKFNQGCFLTSIRSSKTILDNKHRGTIYLGSRKSAVFIRIYDKNLEQSEKTSSLFGFVPPDLPENWTRLEFEFKNDFKAKIAEQAYSAYLSGPGSIGDFVVKYLYVSDTEPYRRERRNATPCAWYFDTIIQNNNSVELEYNETYVRGRVNLVYLQTMYNMLITYFSQVPGLAEYMSMMSRPSESIRRKTINICLDDVLSMAKNLKGCEDYAARSEDFRLFGQKWCV